MCDPLTCAEVRVCDTQEGVDQRVDSQRPQGGVGESVQVLRRAGVQRHQQGAPLSKKGKQGAE